MSLARRLLIANRGEIACRIARTARRLGIGTVAVYSDADAGAPHVRACDQALRIGPPPAAESYLRIDAILDAARRSGADAVHPGYGFLSENAAFADACDAAGLLFVGPPAAAIRAMGSKAEAKRLMAQAGVPLVPGYHGEAQDEAALRTEAGRLGYPLLIKAVAGGGGKGMRRVDRAADFAAALHGCRREAEASFGDARVLLERYVQRPRHVELQVFADRHGGVVHLFERDCSVQRRHQKVLEEAPAPGMTPQRREAMGRAAIEAARAVGYVGAGTVEFIVAPDGAFHFMEMNTRLQVEHPVTEMITGLDLVEWQLRIAAGEPLPLAQSALRIDGHALEARLYAEDPERGFLPATGRIVHLGLPPASPEVRVDSGVEQGSEVTPYYDAMLAKLIVHGRDRDEALARLRAGLARCRIAGVASNVGFLQRLVSTASFARADLDTDLIGREHAALFPPVRSPPPAAWLAAAAAQVLGATPQATASPWDRRDGWRVSDRARRTMQLRCEGASAQVAVAWSPAGPVFELQGVAGQFRAAWQDAATLVLDSTGGCERVVAVRVGASWEVFVDAERFTIAWHDPLAPRTAPSAQDGHLRAPMPGRIVRLAAQPGPVERGAALLVLEAMKMEHTLVAPVAGVLDAFLVEEGDQVDAGDDLVVFRPA